MLNKENIKRVLITAILLIIAIAFAVISWMILPDMVSMQFAGFETGAPKFPKFLAVLIAFGFSAVFAVLSMKTEEAVKYTLIGYGLHVLYWICN